MKHAHSQAELLEQLIADERNLPAPERDWQRIEDGIFARLAEPAESRPRGGRALRYLAFAAAAGIALFAASLYQPKHGSLAGAGTRPHAIGASSAHASNAVAAA